MWLCLSSGARPRYLDDIIRALALPANTDITFRYDKRHVSAQIIQAIDRREGFQQKTLIAYVDQASAAYQPYVIPCRHASIEEITDHGVTLTIVMRLKELAYVEDLPGFQAKLRAAKDNARNNKASDKTIG